MKTSRYIRCSVHSYRRSCVYIHRVYGYATQVESTLSSKFVIFRLKVQWSFLDSAIPLARHFRCAAGKSRSMLRSLCKSSPKTQLPGPRPRPGGGGGIFAPIQGGSPGCGGAGTPGRRCESSSNSQAFRGSEVLFHGSIRIVGAGFSSGLSSLLE